MLLAGHVIDALALAIDVALDSALAGRIGAGWLDMARALAAAPVPRQVEPARPDPDARRAGCVLGRHIVLAVLAIGHGQAIGDQPAIEIDAAGRAHGDNAAIAIHVALFAMDRLPADLVGKSERRLLAAAPGITVGGSAHLPALWRIHAVQPDSLAVDLQGVAVDDRRLAADIREGGGGEGENSGNRRRPNRRLHVVYIEME